jgi:hypothetical protein
MSCCGKKREQMRPAIQGRPVTRLTSGAAFRPSSVSHQVAAFEYVGKTALTAIGPVSGRHYRFSHPGAIVEVDLRDSASLATVPNLRQRAGQF